MAKTATAGATALTPVQAKAAAAERVKARLKPARYAHIPDHRAGTEFRMQITDPEIAEPVDLGEYLDDRLVRCPLGLAFDVYALVLEALRGGPGAVPGAVAIAAAASPQWQFDTWSNLSSMPGGPAEVSAVRAALAREWKRNRLPMTPGQVGRVFFEPMDRDAPSRRAEQVEYETEFGNPAGMRV